jgi:DNA invertase Pin-like site-specific DNA recombinase
MRYVMKLAGYIRVSTQGQVDDGQGLDIQEQAIRRWAAEHGHQVTSLHRDEGVTGTTEDRAGLADAIAAVRYNGAEGLVVSSLDRLARSLTVQEAVLQKVWEAGGRVVAADQGEVFADDPDDPVRTFVRQTLGAVSQLEAAMIARRLRKGRQHKAEKGGYAFGAPPFGYRAEGGELLQAEGEMRAVRRIRELRAKGKSYRLIAECLTAEGLRPKRADRWHPFTIKRIADRAG